MIEYTFKYGTFSFKIHGMDDIDAVSKARRCLVESFPENSDPVNHHLFVELTAGGFNGRLYIEPEEISKKNITKRTQLLEMSAF